MIELRDYQKKLVEAVRQKAIDGFKKILMVLPTGGGKTFIAAEIAKSAIEKGNKVLCLMHRRHLVDQMVDRFEDYGVSVGVIMAGKETNLSSPIQIATIQTYNRRIKIDDDGNRPFWVDAQVVIIDEAHRSLSKSYQNVLAGYDKSIVIGITATPCLSSGIGMGEYYESLVDEIGVSALQSQGHLVPATYYAPSKPDLEKVKTVMGDYDKKEIGAIMNKQQLVGDVYLNWARIAGGLQTIIFAVNVKHSKALCAEFVSHGVNAEHLDAFSDDDHRADVLMRLFGGDIQVISNVGIYTEGFDYPGAECIVLARPTKSMGLYRQMAGRGLRPYRGKDNVLILDHGGCIDRLGLIEDDIVWSLDGKDIAHKKKVVRKKEKNLMTCEYCHMVFAGRRCPGCGREVSDYGRKIEAMDAELVRIKGSKKIYTKDEKIKWFGMFDYYRREKGYQKGWASHKYREKFGCWPQGVDMGPIEPNVEFKNWLKHLFIKYAKQKEKQNATA